MTPQLLFRGKFNAGQQELFATLTFGEVTGINEQRRRFHVDAMDRFLRFAAECEGMAKVTRSRENKAVWNGLAQRWLRCAEMMDQSRSNMHQSHSAKRQRSLQHLPN
jgi:hypothetical protein